MPGNAAEHQWKGHTLFERLNTPEEIFNFKLGSALKMEDELIDVLEELEQHAHRPEIKQALSQHREETRQHVANIKRCFELLGEEMDDSPNPVISAMAKEGKATLKKTDDSLADAIVLVAATESEHYEIAVRVADPERARTRRQRGRSATGAEPQAGQACAPDRAHHDAEDLTRRHRRRHAGGLSRVAQRTHSPRRGHGRGGWPG
jgi:hypothetical protein